MWDETFLARLAALLVGALAGALMAYALHQSLHHADIPRNLPSVQGPSGG